MTKAEVNQRMKEMYLLNASLDENVVKKERKKFHKDVLNTYGNWDKALRVNGITKRKLREREKFMLYFMIQERYEEHGEEAIRPKNIKPDEIKERITDSFKTIKSLKDIIKNWNEDKVLYELHAAFLVGADVEELEHDEPALYEQMLDHFKDVNEALVQYDKRFGIPTIVPEHLRQSEEEEEAQVETHSNMVVSDDLIDMMIKLNYIENEEDARAIVQASRVTKQEILSFLLNSLAEIQLKGQKLDDEYVKEKDLAMHFAIKAEYGNLEEAFKEITRTLVSIG